MEMNLNEYCLQHINTFLKPHELIQVSQVCQLWKQATSKKWKTITEIKYLTNDSMQNKEVLEISAVDAKKIFLCAAPFVEILNTLSINEQSHNLIAFGEHYYKVENLEIGNIVWLLAKKATKITELHFKYPPEASLVEPLFKNNNITKLTLTDKDNGWYRNISTHGIEELNITFAIATYQLVSFREHFPDLKNLTLTIETWPDQPNDDPKDMLSKILPHVQGLKSLYLTLMPGEIYIYDLLTLLSDVAKLSELEELSLDLFNFFIEYPELFLNKLPTCCPKLRVLKLMDYIDIKEESLLKIVSLPNLESLDIRLGVAYPNIELPEMNHMSDFRILILDLDPFFPGFFEEAVNKMKLLENLTITFRFNPSEIVILDIVRKVAEVAISQGKDILITHLDDDKRPRNVRKLRIAKSNFQKADEISDKDSKQTLQLSLIYENVEPTSLFERIQTFVRNEFCFYNVIVLGNKM